jgi:antitoxin (DNA-binding transcriptional repressor) of toxin-antitoxin stability system
MQPGNFPFYIRKGFSGVIEAGTPIAQIIPIKREPWKAISDLDIIKDAERNHKLSNKSMIGWYKQNIWQRKSYE